MSTGPFHAKTLKGLEGVLAEELRALGAENVEPVNRGVNFSGGTAMLYKANFCLRTALRILVPVSRFRAHNEQHLYNSIYRIDWSKYLNIKKSFAVDAVAFSRTFTNSHFVEQKVKDAIVDQFRENTSLRPSVDIKSPDIRINVHISETSVLVSLDSSGESLHKRGYRIAQHDAAINEVLAAGLILLSGWKADKPFLDPMCGSATFPIEAALIAGNIPPGVFRKHFAFEDWPDFDPQLYERVLESLSPSKEISVPIMASDSDPAAVRQAKTNIRSAGLEEAVHVSRKDFMQYEKQEKSLHLIMNPPYGERIEVEDITSFYQRLGTSLKHNFGGSEAWVFSSHMQALKQLGLKADRKLTLFNGSLECRYLSFTLFKGTHKDYKSSLQS